MSTLPLPIAAFFAGPVSFLSPCVLPLVPGYVSLISSVGVQEPRSQESQSLWKVMLNSVGFILGFSIVFIALGAISTGVGQLLAQSNNRIGGLGVFAVNFTPELPSVSPNVRFASGVLVVALSPGPDTQVAVFTRGDIIHALNNASVKSVEQLRSALYRLKPGDPFVLQIERQGKLHYVAFDTE
jgi:S1-C subfamily serine protease